MMNTRRLNRFCLAASCAFTVCSLGIAGLSSAQEKASLPKKIVRQVVEQVIPTIQTNNENAFLNASMSLIQSLKPEQLEAVDEVCKEHDVQPMQDWFTDLVLSKANEGVNPSQAITDLKMAKVVMNGIMERLSELEETATAHAVYQDPLQVPTGFHDSEKIFWDIHVLHNEFQNASVKIQLGRAILQQHKTKLRRKDEGLQMAEELAAVETRLNEHYLAIKERAAVLRLQRFTQAHKTLSDPAVKGDFRLMLTSTMALEQDGSVLDAFFKENDSIKLAALTSPDLPAQITSKLESGRKAAGDVAEKANLFRNGLHYWVRGRYGAGPASNGLVKSPNATTSVAAIEVLYMPRVRDKPISDFHSDADSIPGFDRRHNVSWAAEYRGVREAAFYDEASFKQKTLFL